MRADGPTGLVDRQTVIVLEQDFQVRDQHWATHLAG
jgi:hypothetical protein